MNDETTMEHLLKVINGLWAGTIKIMKSPCRKEPVAYIGNDYQYFLPEGDENLTPEQVMEKYDIVTLATMILKAIEGNDEEDYDYFCDQLGF